MLLLAVLSLNEGINQRGLPHSEVIITTSISRQGVVLHQASTPFYIHDADQWHYIVQTPAPIHETPHAAFTGEPLHLVTFFNPAPLLRAPSLDASKVGRVSSWDRVRVVERSKGWVLLQTQQGTQGWIATSWVRGGQL